MSAAMSRIGRGSSHRPVRSRVLRGHGDASVPRGHHRRGAGYAGNRAVHARRQRRHEGQGVVPPHRAVVRRQQMHRLFGVLPGLPGCGTAKHGARDFGPCCHRFEADPDHGTPACRGRSQDRRDCRRHARGVCRGEQIQSASRSLFGSGRAAQQPETWNSARLLPR